MKQNQKWQQTLLSACPNPSPSSLLEILTFPEVSSSSEGLGARGGHGSLSVEPVLVIPSACSELFKKRWSPVPGQWELRTLLGSLESHIHH